MNDNEFLDLMGEVEKYLKASEHSMFAENPERMADIQEAVGIASKLVESAEISFSDDPLKLGCLAIRIDFYDMVVRGRDEIEQFKALISKADNFEIGAIGDEKTRMSIMFYNALFKKNM